MTRHTRTEQYRKSHCIAALILLPLLIFSQAALSDVTLPGIFGNSMVLQRDMEIPVWGKADPGEEVTVTLDGVTRSVNADVDGKWMVRLPKMNAGGPYRMTVRGKNTFTFGDVMIGEVWLCAGQSNMAYRVGNLEDVSVKLADSDNPLIRMFTIERSRHEQPQDDILNDAPEWVVCTSKTVMNFSAVAYFFGRDIQRELNVPVGLINSSWGGTQAEMWTPREEIKDDPALRPMIGRWEELVAAYPEDMKQYETEIAAWKKAQAEGRTDMKRPYPPPGASRAESPGGIYNAMIHPLIPYGIKGAVWYQGESNSQRGYQYRTLLKTMIRSWRDKWGQGTFPFLIVQLANWETDTNPYTPKDGGNWPELREAQLMALELPNTALTVTIDLGEEADIHPKNKWDVGYRLALSALNIAYGYDIEYSGPLYRSVSFKKNTALVTFSHESGFSARGSQLKGFEIAGADRVYHPAEARIKGNAVIVTSPDVPEPKAVRYAWDDYPLCNLYNTAGLPASPFRTDNWERETQHILRPYFWRE